ncbi:MAG: outer membrane beta-barrel protein [Pirellulales bacterium]
MKHRITEEKIRFVMQQVTLSMGLLLCSSIATADDLKFGLFAGATAASDEANSESSTTSLGGSPATITNAYSVDKNTGFVTGATVGIERYERYSFELEAAYRQVDFDAHGNLIANIGGVTESLSAGGRGQISSISLMSNGWYDFVDGGSATFTPFVGGGIGVASNRSDGQISSQGPLFGLDIENRTGLGNDSETEFAWQFGAGVRFSLRSNAVMSLSYRYFDGGEINGEFDVDMHNIVLAIRF